jgi:hypothetical protein
MITYKLLWLEHIDHNVLLGPQYSAFRIHARCGHNHLFCLLECTIFFRSRFNMCLKPGVIRTPHSPICIFGCLMRDPCIPKDTVQILSSVYALVGSWHFVQVALPLAHGPTVHLLIFCVIARDCVDSHGSDNADYKTSSNCISLRYRGNRRRVRSQKKDSLQ